MYAPAYMKKRVSNTVYPLSYLLFLHICHTFRIKLILTLDKETLNEYKMFLNDFIY